MKTYLLNIKLGLIVFLLSFFAGNVAVAQDSFVQLFDYAGEQAYQENTEALEIAADSLVAAFPPAFQSKFKVFDFGFYLHQEDYDGPGYPEEFTRVVREKIDSEYYLAFGRQTDQSGVNTKTWVDVKLPEGEIGFDCFEPHIFISIYSLVESKVENGSGDVFTDEVAAINELHSHLAKMKVCCFSGRTSCGECFFDSETSIEILIQNGYKLVENESLTVVLDNNDKVTSLKVNNMLPNEASNSSGGNPYTIDYIQDVIGFVNGGSNRFFEIDRVIDGCEIDELPDLGGYDYGEHAVLIYDENKPEDVQLYFKINVSSIVNLHGDDNSRAIAPLAAFLLKRSILGGINVGVSLGVQTLFNQWIFCTETFVEAWDLLEINYWSVVLDFTEGAVDMPPFIELAWNLFRPGLQYLLSTPTNQISLGGFRSSIVSQGAFGVALAALGPALSAGGKFFKMAKKNPNIDLDVIAPGSVHKLGPDLMFVGKCD